MLIVGERIATEDAIHTIYHHPSETIFPHGLTPPLQYVRQRRFRKRVSNRTIEAVEAEVNRLLDADASAEGTWYEVLNAEELLREGEGGYDMLGEAGGDGEEGEEGGWTDAEGVEDYDMVDTVVEDGEDDELALHLESALMEAGEGDGEVGEADMLAALRNLAETDVANVEEEEESDEDEDEDAEGELDEAALEVAQQKQKLMEEIADLQAAFLAQQAELGKAQNPIIKARKQTALDRIKNELEFKRNSLLDAGGSL